jgi:glycerophosphoryl diester phosphodiesterase
MNALLRYPAVIGLMCALVPSALGQMIVAHRGASHDAPENTLSAFKLAMEQGADAFEADFYVTTDGHIVCFHDNDTERISGEKLSITGTPFDRLRRLDVGLWKGARWQGERMATMSEVLAAVPEGKKIFIELKSGPEIVAPMAEAIAASSLSPEQIVIISFNEDAVAECKKQLPHLKACWLCRFEEPKDGKGKQPPTVDEVIATLKRIGADALDAQAVPDRVNKAFVERLRDAGFAEFHVWTVNDPKVARFYRDLGALSITTDRPGWLREQLEAAEGR